MACRWPALTQVKDRLKAALPEPVPCLPAAACELSVGGILAMWIPASCVRAPAFSQLSSPQISRHDLPANAGDGSFESRRCGAPGGSSAIKSSVEAFVGAGSGGRDHRQLPLPLSGPEEPFCNQGPQVQGMQPPRAIRQLGRQQMSHGQKTMLIQEFTMLCLMEHGASRLPVGTGHFPNQHRAWTTEAGRVSRS
jgi:hypothetical protein